MQCPNDGSLLTEIRNPLVTAYHCTQCRAVYPVGDPRLAPAPDEGLVICRLCGNTNDLEFTDHHACHACRVAELTGIINLARACFATAAQQANDHEEGHGVDKLNEGVITLKKVNLHE
jgi:hypothetical protein